MSEWQPARIVNAHKREFGKEGILVRVCEIPANEALMLRSQYFSHFGKCERLFDIHPEDSVRMGNAPGEIVCEHEILTD